MADFGLVQSLAAKENFKQRRQDDIKALQFASQRVKELEKDVQDQVSAQTGIAQYLNTMSQFDVMSPAVDRIKEREKKLRQNVINELEKYNGDSKKFLAAGGQTILEEYRQNLIMSEEVQNAVQSRKNYMQYVKDKSEGKQPLWFNPVKSAQGEQDPITMEDKIEQYRQGEIEFLPYSGAFDPKDINPEHFSQTPNPDGKFLGGNVSMSHFKGFALGKGYSTPAVYQMMTQFSHPTEEGKTIFKWKKEQMSADEILARQRLSGGGSGAYEYLQNILENPYYELDNVDSWRNPNTGRKYELGSKNVSSYNTNNSIPFTNNQISEGEGLVDGNKKSKFITTYPVTQKNILMGVPEGKADKPHVFNRETLKPINIEDAKVQLKGGRAGLSSNMYGLDIIADADQDGKEERVARVGMYNAKVYMNKEPEDKTGFKKVDAHYGPELGLFNETVWEGEVMIPGSVRRPGAAAFSEEQNIESGSGSFRFGGFNRENVENTP